MAEVGQEVVAFLSDRASYGFPGVAVKRIETHCSIVFLIGNRAYKLKRPIAFSNLDYSTLERRAAACHAELELNRRTAPELYLAVRAICRRPGGALGFDGPGSVLDWVVEMRRFPQDDLFDHLADAGLLTPDLMRALADEIVHFHSMAERRDTFGGARGLGAMIEHNCHDQQTVAQLLGKDDIEALREAALAALARVSEQLDARRTQGKVRRGHGDLRLANICLLDSRPTLFDAIEFCDELNCIDVLLDLAFLLMDLQQRDFPVLGNVLFNRYFDAAEKTNGLATLPLMLSVRAANRAYTLALAVERQSESEKAQTVAAAARAHFAFAGSVLKGVAPRIVALGGLRSSLKSAVANQLAAAMRPAPGARVLRADAVRNDLLGLALSVRPPPSAYDPAVTARVYAALGDRTKEVVDSGYSVVIEANFMQASEREAIAALASRASAPFAGLWLGAPEDLPRTGAPGVDAWHVVDPMPGPTFALANARSYLNLEPPSSAAR